MKTGVKTSEFWLIALTVAGLYALIWTSKYPSAGAPGHDGIIIIVSLVTAYGTGRSAMKLKNPSLGIDASMVASATKTSETVTTATTPQLAAVPLMKT